MKFKWPENKQDQMKYIAAIAIGVVLVLVVLVMFVINPFMKAKSDNRAKLAQLREDNEKAQREIDKKPFETKRNVDTLNKVSQISDSYMLHPVLGNYLLAATKIIEKHTRALGITMTKPPTEAAVGSFIQPKKGATPLTVKPYAARITLKVPYRDIVRLIRSIEAENPYATVAGLAIVGNSNDDPERHAVTLDIQWPIWEDEDIVGNIREQLKKGSEEDEEPIPAETPAAPAPENIKTNDNKTT